MMMSLGITCGTGVGTRKECTVDPMKIISTGQESSFFHVRLSSINHLVILVANRRSNSLRWNIHLQARQKKARQTQLLNYFVSRLGGCRD